MIFLWRFPSKFNYFRPLKLARFTTRNHFSIFLMYHFLLIMFQLCEKRLMYSIKAIEGDWMTESHRLKNKLIGEKDKLATRAKGQFSKLTNDIVGAAVFKMNV